MQRQPSPALDILAVTPSLPKPAQAAITTVTAASAHPSAHPLARLAWAAPLLLAALASLAPAPALAQAAPMTVELIASQGRLSAGLPDAQALNLRGTWLRSGGDVLRAELLAEDKFSQRGGLAAAGYTAVLSPDWVAAGTLALGSGGPNWANQRIDLELSRSWGASRSLVTRAALYKAWFDDHRSDRGLRLALVAYLPGSLVLEAGTALNLSEPGAVHSAMPFASATLGRDGEQYLSLRLSRGSEAYLSTVFGPQPVQFDSHSLGLNWRRWIGPQWGVILQAEQYGNPSYRRSTLGAGLFSQW